MRAALAACLAIVLTLPAGAQGIDGLYFPEGETGWSCHAADVGQDGGALAIRGDTLAGVENVCTLSRPVARADGATDYTVTCESEGESYSEDVTLIPDAGGVVLRYAVDAVRWERCR